MKRRLGSLSYNDAVSSPSGYPSAFPPIGTDDPFTSLSPFSHRSSPQSKDQHELPSSGSMVCPPSYTFQAEVGVTFAVERDPHKENDLCRQPNHLQLHAQNAAKTFPIGATRNSVQKAVVKPAHSDCVGRNCQKMPPTASVSNETNTRSSSWP